MTKSVRSIPRADAQMPTWAPVLLRSSADILQKIAKALSISAETLYVQAGILDENRYGSSEGAILADERLTDAQRQALVTILRSFLADNASGSSTTPDN